MKKLLGTLMIIAALLAAACGAGTPTSLPGEESRFATETELQDPGDGTSEIALQARLEEDG